MNVHKSVTLRRAQILARKSMFGLESPGICIACGERADGVEPDAENYACESCGELSVFGAEQLLHIL